MQSTGVAAVTAYTAHRDWASRPPDERYASVSSLYEAARARRERTEERIVETSITVHEEQEHVSVSQVGAGRYPFSAVDAVLVSERQLPSRVIAHEVEHSCCQLVVVDSRVPLRGDGVDCPRFGAIGEELMPVALLPLQPVVDRARRDRRGQGSEVLRRRAGYARELLEAPMRKRRNFAGGPA